MSLRVLVTVGLSIGLLACDSAFKVRGRFVDQTSAPYERCVLALRRGGAVLSEAQVDGKFDETFVFGAMGSGTLLLHASCDGARQPYERKIERMPEKFGDYIELGDVVLQR